MIPADPGDPSNPRLIQAYATTGQCAAGTDPDLCPKVTPIVPTNKRFAEDVITPGATTAPGLNPKLYRVSTGGQLASNGQGLSGHGGLFCEACHGATHAEWPVSPDSGTFIANDNQTALQLQGHTGTVVECDTCHTGSLGNTTNGPHGMHPVGNTTFADGGHSSVDGPACFACHGGSNRGNSLGTVLSEAKTDRNLPRVGFVAKGTPIGCQTCH